MKDYVNFNNIVYRFKIDFFFIYNNICWYVCFTDNIRYMTYFTIAKNQLLSSIHKPLYYSQICKVIKYYCLLL